MPLSEDDQRSFEEIERSFYASDPEFARRVASSPDVVSHTSRNMKLAAVGFVAGLGALVGLFTVNPMLGFLGFALMVGSGTVFVDNLRKAGRVQLQGLTDAVAQRREQLQQRGEGPGWRDRFKK